MNIYYEYHKKTNKVINKSIVYIGYETTEFVKFS